MIDRNLNLVQAREEIGKLQTEHSAVIDGTSRFASNLRKLLTKMNGGSESAISRANANLRRSWNALGISNSLVEAARSLNSVHYDPRHLSHLAFEWTQNGVEHGNSFSGQVNVMMQGGERGLVVSISDNGVGIPDLENRLALEQNIYSADGFSMGRGYGLQGAKNTEEVTFGFERIEGSFNVHLLVTVDQLRQVMSQQAQRILAVQNYA